MTSVRSGSSISVIIPCWQCSGTIERAVHSVMSQTRPASQIILIDDASGDGTAEVLRHIAATWTNIPVYVLELPSNGGPGLARNAGWEMAEGDMIAFLDADDIWHPRKLEIQVGWMECNREVVLTGHRSATLKSLPQSWPHVGEPKARQVKISGLLVSNPLPTRSVVLRRELQPRFGPFRHSEDLMLWLEIIGRGHRVSVLDQILGYSFRPDFSEGGLSGQLLRHELQELRVLSHARHSKMISAPAYVAASSWSLLKFGRRVMINAARKVAAT